MRSLLFIILSFVTASALVAGLLMVNYPDGMLLGVPPDMIKASPFNDLIVPGILLGAGVGGLNLAALYHFMEKNKKVYNWTMAAGIATTSWIVVQFAIVHAIVWMQAVYLVLGIITIMISLQLKHKWLV